VCNRLNLCAIFWEGDLVNRAGTHECEITRNATPEAQECGCSCAALCRCRLCAPLCWTLLFGLSINLWRVITAVVTLGAVSRIAVISARNEDRARIGYERAELPKACVRLCCGEVKDLTTDLRVCACRVAGRFGINEWPRATRRHAQKAHRCWRINAEPLAEELACLIRIWQADANHRAATANGWHESRILCGCQDHVGAGWWLFESLKECVLCRLVHAIGALDQCDAAASFNREEGEAGGKGANRFDADLIRSACWRDEDKVGMAPRGD
jgi:hypothetical protein